CTPEAFGRLPEILWHVEEPLADAAMIPLHELCRQAKRDVTVIHCGDGGDEAFAGYPRFYWDDYAHTMAHLPESIRQYALAPLFRLGCRLPNPIQELCRRGEKFTRFAGLPAPERYMNWFTIMPDHVKRQMLHPDFLQHVGSYRSRQVFEAIFENARSLRFDALGARQYCELNSFIPDDLMLKADKIAMASGLEGRFPFLDERLVEFGLALPPRQKIAYTKLKLPLRKLLARHMPNQFINRGKHGFEVPVTEWFKGSLDQILRDTIAQCRSGARCPMPFRLRERPQPLIPRGHDRQVAAQ
ncbi:MAG: asparagine synthase C-terminal domain-containing protein, partial [Candidatus Hydrogenedentes bacterium]|nr:asparagine synthase C-terminal domain-containing protein [Candidatus Hydrogenedentota bacterium]